MEWDGGAIVHSVATSFVTGEVGEMSGIGNNDEFTFFYFIK